MEKTDRRYELFAQEYCVDLNATRAAIAAGYTETTAPARGSQLLRNRKVKRLIDGILSKRARRLEITGERILEEIGRLALSNMIDFVEINEKGVPKFRLSGINRDKTAAIQELSTDTYLSGTGNQKREITTVKLKLADKKGALEMLAKYRKLFSEKVEVDFRDMTSLSDEQLEARLRERG
jgi:phage terminase small subunit